MIASPRPMPPATKTGTAGRFGRISCASTPVETGPIWPPASMPSMTMASAPMRTSFLAMTSAGAKHRSFMPALLMRWTAAVLGSAHVDERQELGVKGDEINAERAVGERGGGGDLGCEQGGRHGAAGDDAE